MCLIYTCDVSIHAQRGGWAKLSTNSVAPTWTGCFNPRPARWLGETCLRSPCIARLDVSIHAQRGGWAKRVWLHRRGNPEQFQSTPSAVAGRNHCRQAERFGLLVSIHAQRGGWAKRTKKENDMADSLVSIHAQRGGWAKPVKLAATAAASDSFQSTPSAVAGRNESEYHTGTFWRVSIHAQRGGWAKRRLSPKNSKRKKFQSTPSAVAGRNCGRAAPAGCANVSIHAQRGGWAKPLPRVC